MLDELGQAEVQDFDVSVTPAEHDVFRLDVSMNDACFMRGAEGVSRLDSDVEHLAQLHARALHALAQSFAIDELGGDKVDASIFTDFVNGEDVWMIESRSGFGFLYEAAHTLLILCDIRRQNLQSDGAFKFGVLSQIDFTHPARANLRADFIATDVQASLERHLERPPLPAEN